MEDIEEQIKDTLDKIRPFIQREGGDLEFVAFHDGIVAIRMKGACADCAIQDTTVYGGIEMILIDEVPGVIGVEVVA